LSGVDYPVKPLSSIGQVFSSDTEFIAVERKLKFGGDTHFDRYIGRLSLKEFDLFNPRSTSLPLFSKLARGLAYQIRRKPIAEPQIYHGSSWWSITRRAAQSIVEFTDQRPEFLSWLKFANCPDELFVQSILMAGPFATAVSQDFTKFPGLDASEKHVLGCHYVDWTDKASSSPKTLELSDFPSICRSSALFARKIHPTISGPLLDALDVVTLQRGLNSLSAGEGDGSGRGGSSGPV
jgi:hypothetical protein